MKLMKICAVCLCLCVVTSTTAYAKMGDMGYFGGISEGRRLPKTTEVLLAQTKSAKQDTVTLPYKEMIFISGVPSQFEGLIDIKASGNVTDAQAGTYKLTYVVKPGDTTPKELQISRTLTFIVNWRREGNQVIKDMEAQSWTETVTIGSSRYTVDSRQSHYSVSILEDNTAGVTYSRGDISQKAVYKDGAGKITVESSGSVYGYDCAWSNTETQRIDCTVTAEAWSMQYQLRPSVSVSKTLQYAQNEPSAASFEGNYREVMQNKSGMQYDISVKPLAMYAVPSSGGMSIGTYNTFEQLTAPDLSFLKGNAAESDINKLFSMGILSGETKFYVPSQAVTRAEFVTMISKAVKLPIEQPSAKASAKKTAVQPVFSDMAADRPDYPYIMAANKAGLAMGRGNGMFYSDYVMEREEAIVVAIRAVGLSNLGLSPTQATLFADDADISSWAKKEIYAAAKLGLITPDLEGNINPKTIVSKAEAAALVNLLIEYMRTGLQLDYTDHIVNYSN